MRRAMNETRPILDACCGGRMWWFDKNDDRILSMDIRRVPPERLSNRAVFEVSPDVFADFRAMPFPDGSFEMVLFDPPHLRCGRSSFLFKKYGTVEKDWAETLRKGFAECFRVLKPRGTLIFKWSSGFKDLPTVLALTDERPVIIHQSKSNKGTATTSFAVFLKN